MNKTIRTAGDGEDIMAEDDITKQDHIIITVGNQHHDVSVDVDRTHLDVVGAYVTAIATTHINPEEGEMDVVGADIITGNNMHEIMTEAHIITDSSSTQDMTEAHIVTNNTVMQTHDTTQTHIITNNSTQSVTQGHTMKKNTQQSYATHEQVSIMENRHIDSLGMHTDLTNVSPEGQGSKIGGRQTPSVVVVRVMDSYTNSLPQIKHNQCTTLSPQHNNHHNIKEPFSSPQHQITSFSDMSFSPPCIVDDLVTISINNNNSTLTSEHRGDLQGDSINDPVSGSLCVSKSASSFPNTLVSHHHTLDTPASLIPTPSSVSVNSHQNVISVSPCTCDMIDTSLPHLTTCSCAESSNEFLNCGDVEITGIAGDNLSVTDSGGGESSLVSGCKNELASGISNISNESLYSRRKLHFRKSGCTLRKVKDTDTSCTLPYIPADSVLISRELDDGKSIRYETIKVVESRKDAASVINSRKDSGSNITESGKKKLILDGVSTESCSTDILIKRHIGGDASTNGEDFVTIDGKRLVTEHVSKTAHREEKNDGEENHSRSSERQHLYCCCLCGNLTGQKNKTTQVSSIGVFPQSSLDLVSLLKSLSVCPTSLQIPSDTIAEEEETAGGGTFILCHSCYSLVLEADGVYAQVVSLTAQMRCQWMENSTRSRGLMQLSQQDKNTTNGVVSKLRRRNKDLSGTQMPVIRLSRVKNNPLRILNSRDPQTTALTTPDELVEDRQLVLPGRDCDGVPAATRRQELSNKMLICGFCGMDLYGDDEFRLHSAAVHRIRPTWQQWANQQPVLKTRLAKEIQRSDLSGRNRDGGRQGGERGSPRKCTACGREYPVREEFVEHLRLYHNMTIIEQFLAFVEEESTGNGGGGIDGCQDNSFSKSWTNSSGGSFQETSITSNNKNNQSSGRTGQVGTGTVSVIRSQAAIQDEEKSWEQDNPVEIKGLPEDRATESIIKIEMESVTGNKPCISQAVNNISVFPSVLTPNRETTNKTSVSENSAVNKFQLAPSLTGPEAKGNVVVIPSSIATTTAVSNQPVCKHRQWRCRLCSLIFTSQEQHDRHKLLVHPETVRGERRRVNIKKDRRRTFLSELAGKHKTLSSKVENAHQTTFLPEVKSGNHTSFEAKVNNTSSKFGKVIEGVSCKLCGSETKDEDESKHNRLCGTCCENSFVILEEDERDGLKQDHINIFKADFGEEEALKWEETLLVESRMEEGEEEESESVSVVGVTSQKVSAAVGRNLVCGACGETFSSRPALLKHKRSVHMQSSDGAIGGAGRVVCEICGWKLPSVTSLRLHLSKAHRHRSTHKLPLRHHCKLCIFQCCTRTQLERHMQEKHGASVLPPVRCTDCGKTYNAKYIEKHIANMHENLKKYACNYCSMKYNLEASLKMHIFHEHGDNKWWCEVCQVEFDRYHQLRQHRIYIHSTKVYPCRECERSFKRKGDLTEHIKRRHQARVPNKCVHCPKVYSDRKKLRAHLMAKHGVAWEDTLARTYARHQRESNCFKRKPQPTATTRPTHQHQDQKTSLELTTEHTEGPKDDNTESGKYSEILEVSRKDDMVTDEASMTYDEAATSLVDEEHQYNVVHVTHDSNHHLSHMANFSYIILEES